MTDARRLSPLLLALLALLPRAAAAQGEPAAAPPELARVALIGASVTDGFLLPNEVNAMVTLADVVQAATVAPVEAPFRRSNMLFFRDPFEYGARYAADARRHQPSLLVAIDFLFWFGYGFALDEEDRLHRLERGLALLDGFDCPILVGDFPDMRIAARDGVGIHGAPMISEWQVPQPATLERLNERLHAWAAERPDVHVVPVARFFDRVRRGEPVEIRGNTWSEEPLGVLMDKDLLHPTLEGTISLALLALHTLVEADPAIPADAFVWDAGRIRARVLEARAEERRQRGWLEAASSGAEAADGG